MKSIFELVNDITVDKPSDYVLTSSDDFSPYMVQRWLSMIGPEQAFLINELYNIRHGGFDDQMMYDFLITVFPKKNARTKINYIKKGKIQIEKKEQELVSSLANSMELSEREVQEILTNYPHLIDKLKDGDVKQYKKS